jgi:RHS repeat-associated protein
MRYDDAGNLIHDTYTGAGNRTYDGENKITSAWGGNNQAQLYTYDASGQRIKRTVNGVETWQVYGLGGELLAEYPASGPAASPQKEYGYRNGQLLITADAPTGGGRTNVALAANGGVATASSSLACCGWNFTPAGANNGNRSGAGWGSSEGWNDNSPANTFPDWLQIEFNGSKTIDEIDVYTSQDNWQNPSEPTEAMTFSLYGLSGFDVQYWNNGGWTTISGGSVSGNNKVWRKFTFPPITTTKIRVLTNASVDGYSRLTEVEAWTAPQTPRGNVALSSSGATASASSSYSCCGFNFTPGGANNGNRSGSGWGSGEGWNDNAPPNSFPDWLQIDFNGSKTIDEIDVFTVQDNYQNPSAPTESMTFSLYGLTGYEVQYWNDSSWTTITGGSVTGNNKVWRKFTFSPITTTKIRVLTNASVDGYSRITELEAWGYESAPSTNIHWLVTDHLGTPRMIFDQTGSLANLTRHDYLPFGEELFAPTGGRTTAQGYAGDGVRQQFTAQERDLETGLDYFHARYYSSLDGRFTSVDPLMASAREAAPQSWNRYAYVLNNPLRLVDRQVLAMTTSHSL